MKNINLLGACSLGLALLAFSSGCHRKPTGLTPIPDSMQHPYDAGQQNQGISPGQSFQQPESVNSTPGAIPLGNGSWDALFNGAHSENRDKFAADTVYFDTDRATVRASDESKLQDVATYFKSNTTDALIVEGDCDERGTEKYNLALGERRSLGVREYLANLGVDPKRIKTVSYGASKPVAQGHNESSWAKNRRADLVLITPK